MRDATVLADLDRAPWSDAVPRLARFLEEPFARASEWARAPAARLALRPPGSQWTAAQILDHVARTDHFLLILVDKLAARCAKRLEEGAAWPAHAPRLGLLERVAARDFAWDAPDHMRPVESPDVAEVAARLERDRARVSAHLARFPAGEGTLHRIRFSPVDEHLDLYQYLAVLGLHLARHVARLDEASAR